MLLHWSIIFAERARLTSNCSSISSLLLVRDGSRHLLTIRMLVQRCCLHFVRPSLSAMTGPSSPLQLCPSICIKICSWLCIGVMRSAGVQVASIPSDALFILLVEKDAAFMRLAEDRFYNTYPCIIMTAKGQPDVASRSHRLQTFLMCWQLK